MSLSKDDIRNRLNWIKRNKLYKCPSICRLIKDTTGGVLCSECAFLDRCKKIASEFNYVLE